MKRFRRVFLPLLLCFALTGCGGDGQNAEQQAAALRTRYLSMTVCEGRVSVKADYGQRVYDYVLDFTWSRESGLTVTVAEPELVAGVTARVTADGSQLEYDGAVLETGPLGDDGLSPLSALPVLLRDAQERYMAECCETNLGETSALQVTCRDPEGAAGQGAETVLWFDSQTGGLLQGELYEDGYMVILCTFDSFTFDG
ncbi:MAG: hypothetical protein HFF09_00275 [Oscillospiraceae bacterium]|nr:hypothetical protein [Oscillospiraceae bacterium]